MTGETKKQMTTINAAISRINRLYDKWAQNAGVNSFALGVLYALSTEGSITQKQYIEDRGLPKQTVNNVIISLKKDGYITMQPSEEDRRGKTIMLTEDGRSYANELLAPLFQIEESVAGQMGAKMMSVLIESTNAFGEYLEQKMAQKQKGVLYE